MKILSSFLLLAFIFLSPLKSIFASSSVKNLAKDKDLLIIEVQIIGEKANNDFIKIYNSSNEDLDITGYKLRKRSSIGNESSIRVFPQGSKILAKNYFLWANSKDNYHLKIGANVWSVATLAKNNSIGLLNPENKILDALAWGESQNSFVEGQPFPENPFTNQKLKRKQINGIYQDTNNNANDFYLEPISKPENEKEQVFVSESEKFRNEERQPKINQELTEANETLLNTILETQNKKTSVEVKPQQIIDINTASIEELRKITGIGKTLAQKIIEARPFYSLEELTKVNGIGPKVLERIKKQDLAWVDPELKSAKIEKTESFEKGLAVVPEFVQQIQSKQISKSLSIFLIALSIAIFSGIIILFLKNKLKNQNSKYKIIVQN